MDQILKHQGEKLKRVSRAKGITQEQLAEKLEVSRSTIQNYFLQVSLKPEVIEKAAEILGVDKSEFYKEARADHYSPQSHDLAIQKENEYLKKINEMLEKEVKRLEGELAQYKADANRQTG